ncbi:MAG: PadR family transcriptional regulator [Dehalococcoidia bacterium]|nr:PadR family transcriptional regulator [Dehalococcoidia bacterium]
MNDQLRGELDLLLLSTLERGPAHGYALIETLRDRSNGVFHLPEGTVYPALHRLERAGLLTSRWDTSAGRRRRVYTISGAGRQAAHARAQSWHAFVYAIAGVVGTGA